MNLFEEPPELSIFREPPPMQVLDGQWPMRESSDPKIDAGTKPVNLNIPNSEDRERHIEKIRRKLEKMRR